jgi:predicted small integral membrane protein
MTLETKAVQAPVEHEGRKGFLPIETNTFDRVFISIVLFVAISLLWMRFVEFYLPLWISTVISLILAAIIVRKG